MPIIKIDYEKEKISREQMGVIASKFHELAAQVTGYELKDISVFASENQITVNASPVEIYIYADFPDVTEESMGSMLQKLADLVVPFKKEQGIQILFNLSIVKMNWKFKLEVWYHQLSHFADLSFFERQ